MIAAPLLKKYSSKMIELGIKYHMFDSFSGAEPGDETATTTYSISDSAFEKATQINLQYKSFVSLHTGFLPKSLLALDELELRNVRFVSLDLNAARPEINTLKYIVPFLQKGCIIILDDFGFPGSAEQNLAHSELCKELDLPIFHLPTGQGLILIK
jgi:hypothetical protein